MPVITSQLLHRVCDVAPNEMTSIQARSIRIALGGFAKWCVSPNVLRLAQEDFNAPRDWMDDAEDSLTPALPTTRGSCWMPVVVSSDFQGDKAASLSLAALRSGFPFPFRWVPEMDHSSRLPPSVRKLAEQIVEDLKHDKDVKLTGRWGLQLPDEECGLGDCDFSQFDSLTAASGWVPLTVGLLTALDPNGSEVNPSVWSTGAWASQGGVISIEGSRTKARAAVEFGAVRFYSPAINSNRLRKLGFLKEIQLQNIPAGEHSPSKCLRSLVTDFNKRREPHAEDSRQTCEQWFQKHPSVFQATDFYRRRLIDMEVSRCYETGHGLSPGSVSHIVTFLSNRSELMRLTTAYCMKSCRIEGCLIFYTPNDEDLAREQEPLRKELVSIGMPDIGITYQEIGDDPSQMAECRKLVRNWVEQHKIAPEKLLLDLTPGKKWMTLALLAAAPPQSRLLYWQNDNEPGTFRVKAGSETPFPWTAGTPFSLEPS